MYFLKTENDIEEFLDYYRRTFPHATVTPKLHILEHHVVEFIRMWGTGLGMMSEQGAESIHVQFNQLAKTYANMVNPVERLQSMMAEHFRQISPANIIREPPQKKKLMQPVSTCYSCTNCTLTHPVVYN